MRLSFVIGVLVVAAVFWQFIQVENTSTKEVEIRKVLPMDVPYEQMEAGSYLNSIRASMQMQNLNENTQLQEAAQSHADYLVLNDEATHDEVEGHRNFTGVKPVHRAFYSGYMSTQVSENLSTKNYSARNSVDGLLSAIYHRFAFLSPGIDEIGIGVTQDKKQSSRSAFVYLMGNSESNRLCSEDNFIGSGKYIYGVCKDKTHRIKEKEYFHALNYYKKGNPQIILYPYDGQEEVPPAFYEEIPDPLPDYSVSGFPISVEFNDYYYHKLKMYSFKLYVEDGDEVSNVRIMDKESDPHGSFTSKQYALFPLERLKFDTRYRVELAYELQEEIETIIWYFHTQKPTETFHSVTEKEQRLSIEAGRSHIIYFRPLHGHDTIKNIQFPSEVDIVFIDNNTIKLTLMSDNLDDFDIVTGTRHIHIEIK